MSNSRWGGGVPCRYFLKGTCRNGDGCPFAHVLPNRSSLDDPPTDPQAYRYLNPEVAGRYSNRKLNGYPSFPSENNGIAEGGYGVDPKAPADGYVNSDSQSADPSYAANSRYKWISPALRNSSKSTVPASVTAAPKTSLKSHRSATKESVNEHVYGEAVIVENVEEDESTGCYSRLDRLSERERAQFENDDFEMGEVPLVPPPKQFC